MRRDTNRMADGGSRAASCAVATLLLVLAFLASPTGLASGPGFDAVIGGTPVGSPRVVGVVVAAPGHWPSVVALVAPGDGSPADRQFCGATVIAPRWVMTAAHCLHGVRSPIEAADVRVVAGTVDLRAEPADERVVTSLFVHPGYDHTARDARDDIALIELANALDVPAIPLFGGAVEALGPAPGTVVGWGATEFADPQRATYPDALHEAVVPLVSRATCNGPLSYDGQIGDGQLCAGYPEGGIDACVGDSGGPLFVATGRGVEQVGVVSYGRDCAEPLFYGIYTNVSVYRSWVGQYVELPPAETDDGGGASVSWLLVLIGVARCSRGSRRPDRCGARTDADRRAATAAARGRG